MTIIAGWESSKVGGSKNILHISSSNGIYVTSTRAWQAKIVNAHQAFT